MAQRSESKKLNPCNAPYIKETTSTKIGSTASKINEVFIINGKT